MIENLQKADVDEATDSLHFIIIIIIIIVIQSPLKSKVALQHRQKLFSTGPLHNTCLRK